MRLTPTADTLFYGDNLAIMREHLQDESVDLVYLDPPFNSNANYNVLFRSPTGEHSRAQIDAFEDTWHWDESAERAFDEVVMGPNSDAAEMLRAMRSALRENDLMAYLAMMAVRLLELHRVLKPTGSLYLHCDPTASHYLKLILDAIFGSRNYRSELSWRRSSAHNDVKQGRKSYGNVRDVIFFYSKGMIWTWNGGFTPYDESYLDSFYRFTEPGSRRRYRLGDLTAAKPGGDVSYPWQIRRRLGEGWSADLDVEWKSPQPGWEYGTARPYRGRFWAFSRDNMTKFAEAGRLAYSRGGMLSYKRYLDEMPGVPLQNDWQDIRPATGAQSTGYPTQKPVALLERIVRASSNEGDLVLDPFCGCGTTVHAAEKLNRRWIGIDITHLAIGLVNKRLTEAFPLAEFEIQGAPRDLAGARELAAADKHQFQLWALSLIDAQPFRGGRKGADGGIDGFLYFKTSARTTEKAVVSVKGGSCSVSHVRELIATVDREGARLGIFVTLEPPTAAMRREAVAANFYRTEHGSFPKVQLLTVADILDGARPQTPWLDRSVFRQTRREGTTQQGELGI